MPGKGLEGREPAAQLDAASHEPERMSTNTISKTFFTYDSLKCEEKRLETFIDWPAGGIINPSELAKDGFYYLRTNDHCACVFCRGIVGAWEKGDVARVEHQRHFPTCRFINGDAVGNIPIEQSRIISFPENKPLLESVDLPQYSGPKRTDFILQIDREKSFEKWPALVHQKPKELAEAGFFYCGLSDHVRCFHCGHGLRNWEKGDIPWEEHARWYPECIFVKVKKGKDFVEQVRRKKPPHYPTLHEITEREELDLLMRLDIPKAVVDMGFPIKFVRNALRERIEETCVPFFTKDTCVQAVLTMMEQEALKKSSSSSPGSPAKPETSPPTNNPDGSTLFGSRCFPRSSHHFFGNTTNINSENKLETSTPNPAPTNNPAEDGSSNETRCSPRSVSLESHTNLNTSYASATSSSPHPKDAEKQLARKWECTVCMDEEIEIVLLPCTHISTCSSCTIKLSQCPICRGEIKHVLKPIWP